MKYKYKYEIELNAGWKGDSIITFLSNEELKVSKTLTSVINNSGDVVFDAIDRLIISFGKDLYHEG